MCAKKAAGKEPELKCPDCGAPFVPPEGAVTCFCKKCGAKLLIDYGTFFMKPSVIVTQRGNGAEGPLRQEQSIEDTEKYHGEEERFLRRGGLLLLAVVLIVVIVLFIVLNRF